MLMASLERRTCKACDKVWDTRGQAAECCVQDKHGSVPQVSAEIKAIADRQWAELAALGNDTYAIRRWVRDGIKQDNALEGFARAQMEVM